MIIFLHTNNTGVYVTYLCSNRTAVLRQVHQAQNQPWPVQSWTTCKHECLHLNEGRALNLFVILVHSDSSSSASLGSCFLFLSQGLQQETHWSPLQADALQFVLQLVLQATQSHWRVDQHHCEGEIHTDHSSSGSHLLSQSHVPGRLLMWNFSNKCTFIETSSRVHWK